MSKKEVRGGAEKWNLSHLPPGTSDDFTKYVVPMARLKAGTLLPWGDLSASQIQVIIDEVYKEGLYAVHKDDVWTGLV